MKNVILVLVLLLSHSISWAQEKNHEEYYNVNHLSFISAQIPRDNEGHVPANVEEQIQLTFKNLVAVAEKAGASIESGKIKNVVKLNVYLTDPANLILVDKYMLEYITGNLPARTPVGGIDFGKRGFLVSMDAIVELPKS